MPSKHDVVEDGRGVKGFEPLSSAKRIPELDGIRGLAILLVLIWHYGVSQTTTQPHTIAHYVRTLLAVTWSGVDLFFVLSGFLIGGILLDNRHASNYFRVFYVRRICRIFPLYFLWLTLFVGLKSLLPQLTTTPPLNWLFQGSMPLASYVTFTQNIAMGEAGTLGAHWLAVTWSLAVEEQFYLLLPLTIWFIPPRRLQYVLITLIVLAPVLRILLFYTHRQSGFPAYTWMPARADALLLGVLCAYIVRQESLMDTLRRHLVLIYALFAILLIGVAAMIVKGATHVPGWAMSSYGYTLLACLYAVFLFLAVTENRGIVSTITRIQALRRLGLIAYGVYIYHQGVSGLVHGLVLKHTPQIGTALDAGVTIGTLLLVLVIAHVSWSFFERPFVSMGHSLRYKAAL